VAGRIEPSSDAPGSSARAWLAENHLGRYVVATYAAVALLDAGRHAPAGEGGAVAAAAAAAAAAAMDACQPRCESVAGMVVTEGPRTFLQVILREIGVGVRVGGAGGGCIEMDINVQTAGLETSDIRNRIERTRGEFDRLRN
jgi:hypothetical protein